MCVPTPNYAAQEDPEDTPFTNTLRNMVGLGIK